MYPFDLSVLNTVVHVLAASLWIGVTVMFSLFVVPVIRDMPEERAEEALTRIGKRARIFVSGLIVLFLITGVGNLYDQGLLSGTERWGTAYGTMAQIKITLALILFVAFPVAMILFRKLPDQSVEARLRRMDRLHWIITLVSVVIIGLGVTMTP